MKARSRWCQVAFNTTEESLTFALEINVDATVRGRHCQIKKEYGTVFLGGKYVFALFPTGSDKSLVKRHGALQPPAGW